MAKFSKGDKVESVKTGAKGVVDEVYGGEKYAVLFDGSTNPDRVDGFQIKAANGCAKNAKFKIGDKVRVDSAFSSNVNDGMGIVDAIQGDDVIVSFGGYGKVRVPSAYVYINSLASANSVVQNAINARSARNAMVKIDDADGAKRWDALWVKAAELKREAEALDKYLVSKKQYGYSAKLESLAKALTGF